jgi:prepilin-type N-terminal cleavage/methylation domain-containing protein
MVVEVVGSAGMVRAISKRGGMCAMSPKQIRRKDGMTLVELAVVLGVVAIIAVIAIPSYLSILPHMALRDGASAISLLLMQSRMRSIGEMKYFRVTFDLSNDTRQLEGGSVVFDAGSGTNIIQWSVEEAAARISRRVDIHADASDPLVPPFSGDTVIFRPNGTADTAGYEAVYLRNTPATNERYRVKVLGATGKIGVERWAGGTWAKAF